MTADPVTEARTIVRTLRANLGKPIDHDTWRKVLRPAFDTVLAALPLCSGERDDVLYLRNVVADRNCSVHDRRPVDDGFIDWVSAGLRPAIDWLLAHQEPVQGELFGGAA